MRKTRIALLTGLLFCAGAFEAWTASIAPVNLVDLVEIAPRVFEGKCVQIEHSVVKSSDGQVDIPVTRYTFQIQDPIRGITAETLTISQLGKFTDGRRFWADPEVIGLPTYQPGGHYVLFMTAEGKAGLSSPIGMTQGVFRVEHHRTKNLAGNSLVFQGLHDALQGTAYQDLFDDQQGIDLDRFKALIRDLMAKNIDAPSLKKEVLK